MIFVSIHFLPSLRTLSSPHLQQKTFPYSCKLAPGSGFGPRVFAALPGWLKNVRTSEPQGNPLVKLLECVFFNWPSKSKRSRFDCDYCFGLKWDIQKNTFNLQLHRKWDHEEPLKASNFTSFSASDANSPMENILGPSQSLHVRIPS